jgi:hypothetical protein
VALFKVHPTYHAALEKALTQRGVKVANSVDSQRSISIPQAPEVRDNRTKFEQEMTRVVTGYSVGAVVSTAMSDLVGATDCTVM